jgi:mono/diheme cytochrome c family protein
MLFDDPMIARIWSPNLTKSISQYSDDQLGTIIRHGIWPDGTSSPAMPSSMYYDLSDRDVAAIIAFLRTVPPVENDLPPVSIRIMGRFGLAMGEFNMQADLIDHDATRIPPVDSAGLPNGRYLAYTACTECHGQDLEGGFGGRAPPLVIVKAYSPEEFARLLETGVPRDGRDLNVMDDVALSRFSDLTDEEVEALYTYLQAAEAVSSEG